MKEIFIRELIPQKESFIVEQLLCKKKNYGLGQQVINIFIIVNQKGKMMIKPSIKPPSSDEEEEEEESITDEDAK